MQSEWLIVAGCAGLLVNTVLLRYLLRVLGERRVLCIGMLPGPKMRMLHASPAQILSPSDISYDPALMAAYLASSAPCLQLSKQQLQKQKSQQFTIALPCILKVHVCDAQAWRSAACSSSAWPSPAPSTGPSQLWPSGLWPTSASQPSPASNPRASLAMSRWSFPFHPLL